jgi:hypothetical protein
MDSQVDTEQQSPAWTPRHEMASRAMLAFIANAGRDPEQPSLHLPTVATSSVEMADAMLSAMGKLAEKPAKPAPDAPTLAEFAATSGASDVLNHYEAARADMAYWQKRALAAEAKLREQAQTIVAQPYDRRTH